MNRRKRDNPSTRTMWIAAAVGVAMSYATACDFDGYGDDLVINAEIAGLSLAFILTLTFANFIAILVRAGLAQSPKR